MKFSSLVSLSMIAISFAIPLSGTGGADLTNVGSSEAEVYQDKSQKKVVESENQISMFDYQTRLQELSDKLGSCGDENEIEIHCFHSTKALILDLAEEAKTSDLSEEDKEMMEMYIRGFTVYIFPKFQVLAENQCTQLHHFTSDCIYFNFENYAAAVRVFQRSTDDKFKTVLKYDILVEEAKDMFLDTFKNSIYELQRLSEVSTAQWSERAEFNEVEEMLSSSVKIHNEILVILQSKGVEI